MYSENGSLASSCVLFDTIRTCDVALWNSMISAYIDFGCYEEALSLFISMKNKGLKEDERTISIMLFTCAKFADGLRKGKSLHAHAIKCRMKMDVSLGNALLSMYAELNCVEAVQKSEFKPNSYTIISILATCEDETCLNVGRSIHGFVVKHGIEVNLSLNTILTDMYMNCGDEASARTLFESCTNRDLISWNSIIANYINDNQVHEALLLFNRMISEVEPNPVTIIKEGYQPNGVTFLSVMSACSHSGLLEKGLELFQSMIQDFNITPELAHYGCVVDLLGRGGRLDEAREFIKSMPIKPDASVWRALLSACRVNYNTKLAENIFEKLAELEPMNPGNYVLLSNIYAAAGHWLEVHYFTAGDMSHLQSDKIYANLNSLLSTIKENGYVPDLCWISHDEDASVWRALLSACRVNYNTKLAENIFEKVVELEPMNPGNYVLLSNIYAAAGHWLEVRQIRTWIKEMGLNKPPGISWIVVHYFTAGDMSHLQSDKIYANLNSLLSTIKENGYVPDLSWISHDEEHESRWKSIVALQRGLAGRIKKWGVENDEEYTILLLETCHTFNQTKFMQI
ncbi:pentatricopeptide repeat-containing protein [Quercus suber]|uniref:Pentatricopeptide repeat-containing protein n=1 Tax=Quercus suber TaxID=58331 RepID=A0AAW0LX92_QUESU